MKLLSQPLSTLLLCLGALCAAPALAQPQPARSADFIAAVVNNELVTQFEVEQRVTRARDEMVRSGVTPPSDAELRKRALDVLVTERVIVTWARESGLKVDDQELDRAVANIASMNKLTVPQLRERLREEGIDPAAFRNNLRDQMLSERVREREVPARIKVSDAEIQDYIDQQRARSGQGPTLNIAQILVTVPDGASAEEVARRKAKADAALARVRAGEAFDAVAKELSEDNNRQRGGELGARPVDRLPDLFVEAVRDLPVGGVSAPVRSGAGFHVLKLLERNDPSATTTQTRARHILLRPSARLTPQAAAQRLEELRAQIVSGKRSFETVAREVSEDGSAASGGDLGWASPGQFVPEFEEAMNRLQPGGVSPPIESRYGWHLIQVVERRTVPVDKRQLREQARNALREQKYDAAYAEWVEELRSRAYIELREPPQ